MGIAAALVVGFAFVGLVGSCLITLGIWPGEVKLLAPVFCSDAQPDPFVVADTTSQAPGETSTTFSMYCMGPRGDVTDQGFARPFLLISVVNGIAITALVVALWMIVRLIRQRRREAGADPAITTGTAGPFVT